MINDYHQSLQVDGLTVADHALAMCVAFTRAAKSTHLDIVWIYK